MIYKYSIFSKSKLISLVDFLSPDKFEYVEFENLIKLNEKAILFIGHETNEQDLLKNEYLKDLKENIVLVVPNKFRSIIDFKNLKNLYYPLHFLEFNKLIDDFFFQPDIMFKDLCLKKSNYLLNVENKKKTYLTETEFSILKLLLQEKKIKKEKLRIDILELRSSVETKSLESHLSRIRKKINEIDSCVSISSPGNNQVAIF